MNGTTRCPHCETRFKIVEAQLNAHHGMVRCGSCLKAFDSRPDFIAAPATPDELTVNADLPDGLPVEPAVEEGVEPPLELPPLLDPENLDPEKIEPEELASEIVMPAVSLEIEPIPHDKTDIKFFLKTESVDSLDFSQMAETSSPPNESVIPDAAPASLTLTEIDAEQDSATLPPKQPRWTWIAGSCLLAVLLIAQAAYFFRIGIASNLPALKPVLVGYCDLLGCQVSLPRHAESISIESSGLEADPEHENIITLSALLRNRASYALEFPVLALTLNDNQDKTLARRLLMPADYLPATENKLAGFPASHEVSVRLNLNTADLKPLGYRLELFYN
ncbi:MAG: zinc-ribbon and DUF3426 domain-containing protein [Gallionella sp.]|jgi:predicted Zn finger-like uncharacterized protein